MLHHADHIIFIYVCGFADININFSTIEVLF